MMTFTKKVKKKMTDYEWVLAISVAGHDANITLLHNGEIVLFLNEERISRQKHDSQLPLKCLSKISDYTHTLDKILFCNTNSEVWRKEIFSDLRKYRIKTRSGSRHLIDIAEISYLHHNYHATCGFYFSPFDEAICLVVDGWGSSAPCTYSLERTANLPGFDDLVADESTSIFHMKKGSGLSLLKKYTIYDPHRMDGLREIMERQTKGKVRNDPTPYKTVKNFLSQKRNIETTEHIGIGVMYGVVTAFLGYASLECGKTMGLSSYGEEDDSLPPMFVNEDSILCNKNLFSQSRTLKEDCYPVLKTVNDSIQKKANLSYSMQKALEKVFIERVKFIDENYKCKNIILSGGCALNVVGNSVLAEKFPHMNFFVDPIPHDAGQSLGLAIDWYQQRMSLPDNSGQNCYLGKEYSKDELRASIEDYVKRDGVKMFRKPWGQEGYIKEGDQL